MHRHHSFACSCCNPWSRRRFIAAMGAQAAALVLAPRVVAAAAETVPTIGYDSVPNLLHLPRDLYLGEVSGVALNSKGHIFVLSRGNTTGPAYAAAAT